jgi:hypothetical protein
MGCQSRCWKKNFLGAFLLHLELLLGGQLPCLQVLQGCADLLLLVGYPGLEVTEMQPQRGNPRPQRHGYKASLLFKGLRRRALP